ncbi:hypothetical protein [Priestia megaterium]|uniref:hypothetical protein n=1 Tax=Priestia megaterium TaxID=1404 RepID=UPI0015D4F19F|nr:hypothetical protein [Priestia megaterium]
MLGQEIEWEGTIIVVWNKKIVVYGGEDYNGETWTNITTSKRAKMLPDTFIG